MSVEFVLQSRHLGVTPVMRPVLCSNDAPSIGLPSGVFRLRCARACSSNQPCIRSSSYRSRVPAYPARMALRASLPFLAHLHIRHNRSDCTHPRSLVIPKPARAETDVVSKRRATHRRSQAGVLFARLNLQQLICDNSHAPSIPL